MAGEETVVPQGAQRIAEFGASALGAAMALNSMQRARIEEALTECANQARTKVLLEHMDGRSPTPAECLEEGKFGGKMRTRAQYFGEEMHKAALECAGLKLSQLRPGGFSLEPRYRFDAATGWRELITPEQEELLLEEGCYNELRGTIKPDVVIHSGNPLLPLAVFDFKFPCVNKETIPWCLYTKGPHKGRWQNDVYLKALGIDPKAILPWLGVTP